MRRDHGTWPAIDFPGGVRTSRSLLIKGRSEQDIKIIYGGALELLDIKVL